MPVSLSYFKRPSVSCKVRSIAEKQAAGNTSAIVDQGGMTAKLAVSHMTSLRLRYIAFCGFGPRRDTKSPSNKQ